MACLRGVSLLALTSFISTTIAQEGCGSSFVAFGYGGANLWNCDPWIDAAMQPYLAWYNGSTTITHGGGDCTDSTVFQSVKNAFAIGGMTVPGNSSLDRTSYDKNPYYFWFPSASGADIALEVQSSSDVWYTELQNWELGGSRSGDGYDLTGTFIGKVPSNNYFYWPGTDCRDGGDIWPSSGYEDGDEWGWTLSGHVSPEAAEVEIKYTWTQSSGLVTTTSVKYSGTPGEDGGPRLVTTGEHPTTDAVYAAPADPSDPSPPPPGASSSSSEDSSTATASATGTSSTSTSTGSTSAEGSAEPSDNGASSRKWSTVGVLLLIAGVMFLA
ncbi:hypothetical protein H2200_005404 [Cladophialophora chaetospira]|uniref:Uncharacterized protein n=1 Tax=Cladophialophora chaetospira TaxID=386627 RepID=A0AA38XC51_9EURO|nr:hypothetical protein H2200_005404 [Cladophialophora chaetospira]